MRPPIFAVFAILLSPLAAHAQTAPVVSAPCAEMDQQLPAELLAWPKKAQLSAASGISDLGTAMLVPGQAYLAALVPTSGVTYVVQPGKPGEPASRGGLFALDVPKAGAYVVALGAGAWIDVLKGDAVQRSIGHGHGPACTTLRKMVTFDLQPGRHLIQITGATGEVLPIMVAAKP